MPSVEDELGELDGKPMRMSAAAKLSEEDRLRFVVKRNGDEIRPFRFEALADETRSTGGRIIL